MPTYEYKCRACGKFEAYQSITAPPLKRCPTCGGAVRRLIGGGAGVLFKGSGFYQTDYRSEAYKRSARAETAAPAAKSEAAGKKTAAESSKAKKP